MEDIDYKIDILNTSTQKLENIIDELKNEGFKEFAEELQETLSSMSFEKLYLEEEQDKIWKEENTEQNKEYERSAI